MIQVLDDIGGGDQTGTNGYMHAVISVTAWSDNTTIYYDHWENGYGFDPDNPVSTADETVTLVNSGDSQVFESADIPTYGALGANTYGRDPGETFYDGRDRIYVAGGAVTVTRASWTEAAGTLHAVAWEIYPVRPQLTTYILPFGEDLAPNYDDFDRVYALIQATEDGTVIQVDLDKDGVYDDLDWDRDGTTVPGDNSHTLAKGESFLLDQTSINGATAGLNSGTLIQASSTVQVQYVIGDQGTTYEVRGLSAFPRGFWDDEYYAPVSGPANGRPVDIYLYNPHESAITITYETSSGPPGTFDIPSKTTLAYSDPAATNGYVPQGSSVYLKGTDVFWGISTIDAENTTYDWAYSLVPAFLLENEHYVGWAPGAYADPILAVNRNDSGLFIAAAQDNITLFVDFNGDGYNEAAGDASYNLSRLETLYVHDSVDGDMSNANIFATGPYVMAYGQNPDTAPAAAPALDLGYTTIPGNDFIELVFTVDKSVSPQVVSTVSGSQAQWTLEVNTYDFSVDGISVSDTLPPGWEYVAGSTVITLPDNTQVTGATADDGNSSGDTTLTWSGSDVFGGFADLAANQKISITFTAETNQAFAAGDLSINRVNAVGKRTVEGVEQTFSTTDFAFVIYGDYEISKTSNGSEPLGPGDRYTYTIEVTNPATATEDLTGISIYDEIPQGVSYVAGTSRVQSPTSTVGDRFNTAAYNNQDGTDNWTGNWDEHNDDDIVTSGLIRIAENELLLSGVNNREVWIDRQLDLSEATSAFWSFDYRTSAGVDAADQVDLWIYSGGWILIDSITGITGESSGTHRIDISSYNAVIWVAFSMDRREYAGDNETFAVDNNYILYGDAIDTAAGTPPNFLSARDGYGLKPGETLTLTFDVVVDDPLPTGLSEIVNTVSVTTNRFRVPLTAQVTNLVNNPSSDTGEVGDLVWLDTDGDGVKDTGESGLSNVKVTLKDSFGTPLATTYTDGNGKYRFTGIAPGTGYYVEVTGGLPSGLVQSAPAGHSDDRTDPFDLSAGQVYLDADLGYTNAAGTGSIGDFVWNDDNGDGIQDSGELGLSGVTVRLYLDVDNDGVFEPSGDDSTGFVATTVTGPDGTYLFNNVDATDGSGTDDYFVYVDATQAALSGYDYTTSPVTRVIDLADGQVSLVNDFGFENTSGSTYTYADRVWFDADDEGDYDDGVETGISGVTVNLLNASRQVVATVTTDANGEFSFSGLSGSTFYYVEISDTAGKLTDYYGTTVAALAGELQISNLTGDVDNTDDPNFGYNAKGAIGDTVFNDVDGDGTQDAGELGISGIEVKLYNDDDGDGVIDAGDDQVLATVTTDANGNYMFSGLADGDYIVSIETPPSGYDYTGTGVMADSDSATAGAQLGVNIAGGGSNLDIDFGFRVPPADQRSISGTLWHDLNNDGSDNGDFDGGSYFSNVTVELRDSGGALVGVTTTDANGQYSFTGLGDGTYTVRITDDNNVLSGYDTTYEETEGGLNPTGYNGQEEVVVSSGNPNPTIDFGYYNPPVVTRAVIGDFGAYNDGGKVVVRWQTVSEHGTVGFYLHRLDEKTGKYKVVNKKLLPGLLFAPAGGWYSYEDKKAKTGAYYTYRLEEVEVSGKRLTYGPWKVFTGTPISGMDAVLQLDENAAIVGFRQEAKSLSDKVISRMEAKMESRLNALAAKMARKGIQAKISVTEDGIYFIDANDIATVLDISVKKVSGNIKKNKIRLSCMGQKVAVLPADDYTGIYFYGERHETRYSDENIYWLDVNNALTMNEVKRVPKKPLENLQYFYQWVWEEESQYPMTGLFSDSSADFWMWDYVFPGYGRDQVTFPVSLQGILNVDAVTLTVSLQGGSEAFDGNDHHALIRLNGELVAEAVWDGLDAELVSVPVSPDVLIDGENLLEVAGMQVDGVPYNIFYVNNFQFVYPKQYRAEDNFLIAENNGYETLRMDGFTDSDIRVFDITNPRRPKSLSGTVIEPSAVGENYQVSFRAGTILRRYLALTPEVIKPCTLIADQPSFLTKRVNLGEYLVITSSDMVSAAQTLADYRTSRGHLSQVVDVEDIYDEFSYGITDAQAIRAFLAHAYSKWRIPPKYVLLAGDGSFDYKDFLGFGDAVVPALIAGTPEGLRVTDFPYADVVGDDRIPEFSVGRIPVISAEELGDYIDKVIGYELSGGAWTTQGILAADAPDSGGDFIASSEELAGLFPGDYLLDRLYLDTLPIAEGRLNLVNGINEGRAYVNFVGHGTMFQIGNQNLFSTSDLSKLNNGTMAPVLTAMTCIAGDFGYPGFDGLSEELVMKSDGGAVAMWAPSGYAYNQQSMALCNGFYNAVFIGGETRIGDAIRRSFENYAISGEEQYHLDLYNLIGDPALVLK